MVCFFLWWLTVAAMWSAEKELENSFQSCSAAEYYDFVFTFFALKPN